MEVTIEDEKYCRKLFKVEVSKEEIEADFLDAYKKIGRNTVIPGFRKGKAPISLIRNRFKNAVTDELKGDLPFKYFKEYSYENNIVYFGDPTVRSISLDEEKGMKFSLVYETLPDLTSIDLSKISIHEVEEKKIGEDDIEQAVSNLRRAYAVLSPLSDDQLIEKGDYIKFDYAITPRYDQGKNDVESETTADDEGDKSQMYQDLEMELTENRIASLFVGCEPEPDKIKQFVDFIVGMKVGDEKTFKMEPPYPLMKTGEKEDSPENEAESKPSSEPLEAELKIVIKEAKKIELPEVNEDFAQMVINEKDVDKLHEKVKDELEENVRENARNEMKWAILNEIFKKYPFDVPKTLVLRTLDNIRKRQGMPPESGVEDDEEFEKRHMLESYLSTKIDVLFDYIIKTNNLEFSQEKLDKQLAAIAKINNQELTPEFRQKLGAQGTIKAIKQKLLIDSVVDFLLDNVVILPPKEEVS